eukprot:gene782-1509_t
MDSSKHQKNQTALGSEESSTTSSKSIRKDRIIPVQVRKKSFPKEKGGEVEKKLTAVTSFEDSQSLEISPSIPQKSTLSNMKKANAGPKLSAPSYEDRPCCMLCADTVHCWAIGQCNHPICSLCAVRVRIKSKDRACVICKQLMDVMVICPVTASPSIPIFHSFGVYDCSPVPGFIVDESMGLAFVTSCSSHYQYIDKLRSYSCPAIACNEKCLSITQLQSHLKTAHNKQLCSLCVENRPLFISELPLYTPQQLDIHMKAPPGALTGAGEDKVGGHMKCRLCKGTFFDAQQLLQHMRSQHCTCPLCTPIPPLLRYFVDDASLWEHIQTQHMTCPLCFEGMGRDTRSFRPYSSPQDLISHMQVQHAYQQSSSRKKAKNGTYVELDPSSPDPYTHSAAVASKRNEVKPSATVDRTVQLVPSNMRIAGRVTGTGNFKRDAGDDAMEKHSSQAHAQRNKASGSWSQGATGGSDEDFPALGGGSGGGGGNGSGPSPGTVTTGRSGTGTRIGMTFVERSPRVHESESSDEASSPIVAQKKTMSKREPRPDRPPHTSSSATSGGGGGGGVSSLSAQLRSMGLGSSLQGVGKKLVPPDQLEKMKLLERREQRSQMLLDAFGVPGMEEGGDIGSLLRRPIYASSLLAWGKKQRALLLHYGTFSQIHPSIPSLSLLWKALIGEPFKGISDDTEFVDNSDYFLELSTNSESSENLLVPSEYLCPYYRMTGQEFDVDRRKYISVVKAPDSALPVVSLSQASDANQQQGYIIPLLNAPLENRRGQPMLVFEAMERTGTGTGATWQCPTIARLISYLREVGVEYGAIVFGEGETVETLQAREDGNVILRPAGFGSVIVEFPCFLAAFKAQEMLSQLANIQNKGTSSTTRPRSSTTPSFPFLIRLAFGVLDLEAEANIVREKRALLNARDGVIGGSSSGSSGSSFPPPPGYPAAAAIDRQGYGYGYGQDNTTERYRARTNSWDEEEPINTMTTTTAIVTAMKMTSEDCENSTMTSKTSQYRVRERAMDKELERDKRNWPSLSNADRADVRTNGNGIDIGNGNNTKRSFKSSEINIKEILSSVIHNSFSALEEDDDDEDDDDD